jgi:Protein of unknown function (DUF2934)
MVDSHAATAVKRNTLATPKTTIPRVVSVSDAAGLENQIRERAYQLYEGRGCEPGQDRQDWVQAEHEILNLRP